MPTDPPLLSYTEHALNAMAEREVSPDLVRQAVAAPDLRAPKGRGRREAAGAGIADAPPNDDGAAHLDRHSREAGTYPHDRHSSVGRNLVGRASAHETRRSPVSLKRPITQ